MSLVVEHLPSMHKVLKSIPRMRGKEGERRKEERETERDCRRLLCYCEFDARPHHEEGHTGRLLGRVQLCGPCLSSIGNFASVVRAFR